jgi:hypothetical protein
MKMKIKLHLSCVPLILSAILLILKICGVIKLDFFWVLFPMMLAAALYIANFALLCVFAIVIPWLNRKFNE